MKALTEILKGLDLFSMLSPDELNRIHAFAEEVDFRKGELIIKEGIPSDSLFVIKKGSVRVTKNDQLIVILGEGNPVGELSFIDKGLPSATVIAEEDSTLIKIPSDAFEELMISNKEMASKVYKSIAINLSQKLRDTNEWLFTKDWLTQIEKELSSRLHL